MTTQTEEAVITEEDLELIKERETNIRQLEVMLGSLYNPHPARCRQRSANLCVFTV